MSRTCSNDYHVEGIYTDPAEVKIVPEAAEIGYAFSPYLSDFVNAQQSNDASTKDLRKTQ